MILRPVHGSQTARSRPHCHSGWCFPATSGSPWNCGSGCEAPRNQPDAGASGATARRAAGPRAAGVGVGRPLMSGAAPRCRCAAVAVCRRHWLTDGRRADRSQPAVGRHAVRRPISWFQRAHLISTPSMLVLGKVGLGEQPGAAHGARAHRLRRSADGFSETSSLTTST